MRNASGIFGIVAIVFLFAMFIAAIVFAPVIFGAAEEDLNMTENSTYYNETQSITGIVLLGVELSPVLFYMLMIGILVIAVYIFVAFARAVL